MRGWAWGVATVIADDWQSITVVFVGDYRRENGGMQRYRPTGIVCLNCFGGDELDVLCEVRSLAEDEGMGKVYGTSGAKELGRTLSEDPLAPNVRATSPFAPVRSLSVKNASRLNLAGPRPPVPDFDGTTLGTPVHTRTELPNATHQDRPPR